MASYIAYYRVSTDRQGASGLGLDAQRAAVSCHIDNQGQLVAEYTEIESGRRHTNRPQLLAALEECRKHRAVLLIARLDRLARNVAVIANLMESKADFIAVDMPQATRLTIHILAAVAEHEREMISKRTKAALSAQFAPAPWLISIAYNWAPGEPEGLSEHEVIAPAPALFVAYWRTHNSAVVTRPANGNPSSLFASRACASATRMDCGRPPPRPKTSHPLAI
jgi:hypothetical protein